MKISRLTKVRPATQNDLETIRELSIEFWQTHNPQVPFDPDYFMNIVKVGIDDPMFLALLLNDNQGMILGIASRSLFAPTTLAKEIVWFTRPAARGRGMHLMRAFLLWAKVMGMEHVHCTLQQASPAMERMGFFPTEVGYMRAVVNPGPDIYPIANSGRDRDVMTLH